MLDWRTGRLRPHDEKYLCTFKINADYDPNAREERVIYFLSEVAPHDSFDLIEELLGYLIRPVTHLQKAFMLLGAGANGKSTFLSALSCFLGKSQVSRVSLQDFDMNRFSRAELQGKLANIYPDLPSKGLEDTGVFKALVAGDPINAERKHQHPFVLETSARLLFSANELPRSHDLTHAYFRRWVIIPFENRFEGSSADPNLVSKLTTGKARSTFLRHAIEGLRRLEKNKGFSRSNSVLEAGKQYRKSCDSVYEFTEEHLTKNPKSDLSKTDVYNDYANWCTHDGIKVASKKRFNKRLEEVMGCQEGRAEHGGKMVRIWKGLARKGELPLALSEEGPEDVPF